MEIKSALKSVRVWCHAVWSQWICMRSEVGLWCQMSRCNWKSHMPQNWPLTSHAYSSWPHTLKFISKLILIFTDLVQLHFCLAHKNSRVLTDCHNPVILLMGEDKMFMRPNVTRYLALFNSEMFFKLFTSFLIHHVQKVILTVTCDVKKDHNLIFILFFLQLEAYIEGFIMDFITFASSGCKHLP